MDFTELTLVVVWLEDFLVEVSKVSLTPLPFSLSLRGAVYRVFIRVPYILLALLNMGTALQ